MSQIQLYGPLNRIWFVKQPYRRGEFRGSRDSLARVRGRMKGLYGDIGRQVWRVLASVDIDDSTGNVYLLRVSNVCTATAQPSSHGSHLTLNDGRDKAASSVGCVSRG